MNDRPQQKNRPQIDVWLYRMIIAALNVLTIASVVGTIALASTRISRPDAIIAFGSAGIRGMAASWFVHI